MKPQLRRLNADILYLKEVNGQEIEGEPRKLLALKQFIKKTPYEDYHIISTKTADGYQVYYVRNLVILSKYPIALSHQYRNDPIEPLVYPKVMASPAEDAKESRLGTFHTHSKSQFA
jgi:endonuclease/exonuclease/phosphatase family metal-dependent hydrolase